LRSFIDISLYWKCSSSPARYYSVRRTRSSSLRHRCCGIGGYQSSTSMNTGLLIAAALGWVPVIFLTSGKRLF